MTSPRTKYAATLIAENIYLLHASGMKALSWALNIKWRFCMLCMEPKFSLGQCVLKCSQRGRHPRERPAVLKVTKSAHQVKKSLLGNASYNSGTPWLQVYSNMIVQTCTMKCTRVLGNRSSQFMVRHFLKLSRGVEVICEWIEIELLPTLVFCFLLDISIIIVEVN